MENIDNAFDFKLTLYLFIEELYINDLITDDQRENIDNYIKHNI